MTVEQNDVRYKGNPNGEKWFECDICGWPYPESELVFNNGHRVCIERCVDQPGHKDFRRTGE